METVRLILGSKAFATIAGGSLLMVLGAALGVAIGSDSSSNAATSHLTVTKNGTTRIVAVSAKPETKTVKHTVTKRKTVHKPGSTSIQTQTQTQTVTGPSQTVIHTVTQTKTVPTTVTQTVTVTTGPPPPP
jgi:hypothetical protein